MTRIRTLILALTISALLLAGSVMSVFASPSPPTEGGNGAGMSGQCTGNPADRPAVCPGT